MKNGYFTLIVFSLLIISLGASLTSCLTFEEKIYSYADPVLSRESQIKLGSISIKNELGSEIANDDSRDFLINTLYKYKVPLTTEDSSSYIYSIKITAKKLIRGIDMIYVISAIALLEEKETSVIVSRTTIAKESEVGIDSVVLQTSVFESLVKNFEKAYVSKK